MEKVVLVDPPTFVDEFTPALDHIIVKRHLSSAETSGLVGPEYTPVGPVSGTVLAVGPGRPSEYTGTYIEYGDKFSNVTVGDIVIYHSGAGFDVEHGGKKYRFVFPRDIIAVKK